MFYKSYLLNYVLKNHTSSVIFIVYFLVYIFVIAVKPQCYVFKLLYKIFPVLWIINLFFTYIQ